MLVNEAIIDVAIGAAKFRGEYPYNADFGHIFSQN
jgi:hypothetical protein